MNWGISTEHDYDVTKQLTAAGPLKDRFVRLWNGFGKSCRAGGVQVQHDIIFFGNGSAGWVHGRERRFASTQ